MIAVFVAARTLLQATFLLTVAGGIGSGTYPCGATVVITTAATSPTFWTTAGVTTKVSRDLSFLRWSGDTIPSAQVPQTTLTMPCRAAVVYGVYSAGTLSSATRVIVR